MTSDDHHIQHAAKIIADWWVVAFPTETVYWLGANIHNADAVRRIFEIKGRASDNPLIVHIHDIAQLKEVAVDVPDYAYDLAQQFWPWPLALVLHKSDRIIDAVSAGQPTVAVRMPDHDIALSLIRQAGVPIAAPSANLSGKPSPTTASHVAHDIGDRVDAILDGWATQVGIESTVIDLTISPPVILRPWSITAEDISTIIPLQHYNPWTTDTPKSPGMKYRHYAPDTQMVLIDHKHDDVTSMIQYYHQQWQRVGVITTLETQDHYPDADHLWVLGSRKNLSSISHHLFATLRQVDAAWCDIILCESFERVGVGVALMDRLTKACEGKKG